MVVAKKFNRIKRYHKRTRPITTRKRKLRKESRTSKKSSALLHTKESLNTLTDGTKNYKCEFMNDLEKATKITVTLELPQSYDESDENSSNTFEFVASAEENNTKSVKFSEDLKEDVTTNEMSNINAQSCFSKTNVNYFNSKKKRNDEFHGDFAYIEENQIIPENTKLVGEAATGSLNDPNRQTCENLPRNNIAEMEVKFTIAGKNSENSETNLAMEERMMNQENSTDKLQNYSNSFSHNDFLESDTLKQQIAERRNNHPFNLSKFHNDEKMTIEYGQFDSFKEANAQFTIPSQKDHNRQIKNLLEKDMQLTVLSEKSSTELENLANDNLKYFESNENIPFLSQTHHSALDEIGPKVDDNPEAKVLPKTDDIRQSDFLPEKDGITETKFFYEVSSNSPSKVLPTADVYHESEVSAGICGSSQLLTDTLTETTLFHSISESVCRNQMEMYCKRDGDSQTEVFPGTDGSLQSKIVPKTGKSPHSETFSAIDCGLQSKLLFESNDSFQLKALPQTNDSLQLEVLPSTNDNPQKYVFSKITDCSPPPDVISETKELHLNDFLETNCSLAADNNSKSEVLSNTEINVQSEASSEVISNPHSEILLQTNDISLSDPLHPKEENIFTAQSITVREDALQLKFSQLEIYFHQALIMEAFDNLKQILHKKKTEKKIKRLERKIVPKKLYSSENMRLKYVRLKHFKLSKDKYETNPQKCQKQLFDETSVDATIDIKINKTLKCEVTSILSSDVSTNENGSSRNCRTESDMDTSISEDEGPIHLTKMSSCNRTESDMSTSISEDEGPLVLNDSSVKENQHLEMLSENNKEYEFTQPRSSNALLSFKTGMEQNVSPENTIFSDIDECIVKDPSDEEKMIQENLSISTKQLAQSIIRYQSKSGQSKMGFHFSDKPILYDHMFDAAPESLISVRKNFKNFIDSKPKIIQSDGENSQNKWDMSDKNFLSSVTEAAFTEDDLNVSKNLSERTMEEERNISNTMTDFLPICDSISIEDFKNFIVIRAVNCFVRKSNKNGEKTDSETLTDVPPVMSSGKLKITKILVEFPSTQNNTFSSNSENNVTSTGTKCDISSKTTCVSEKSYQEMSKLSVSNQTSDNPLNEKNESESIFTEIKESHHTNSTFRTKDSSKMCHKIVNDTLIPLPQQKINMQAMNIEANAGSKETKVKYEKDSLTCEDQTNGELSPLQQIQNNLPLTENKSKHDSKSYKIESVASESKRKKECKEFNQEEEETIVQETVDRSMSENKEGLADSTKMSRSYVTDSDKDRNISEDEGTIVSNGSLKENQRLKMLSRNDMYKECEFTQPMNSDALLSCETGMERNVYSGSTTYSNISEDTIQDSSGEEKITLHGLNIPVKELIERIVYYQSKFVQSKIGFHFGDKPISNEQIFNAAPESLISVRKNVKNFIDSKPKIIKPGEECFENKWNKSDKHFLSLVTEAVFIEDDLTLSKDLSDRTFGEKRSLRNTVIDYLPICDNISTENFKHFLVKRAVNCFVEKSYNNREKTDRETLTDAPHVMTIGKLKITKTQVEWTSMRKKYFPSSSESSVTSTEIKRETSTKTTCNSKKLYLEMNKLPPSNQESDNPQNKNNESESEMKSVASKSKSKEKCKEFDKKKEKTLVQETVDNVTLNKKDRKKMKENDLASSNYETENISKMCKSIKNDSLMTSLQKESNMLKSKIENDDDSIKRKQAENKNLTFQTKYDSLKCKVQTNEKLIHSIQETENNLPLTKNKSVKDSDEKILLTKASSLKKEEECRKFDLKKEKQESTALVEEVDDSIKSNKEDKTEGNFKEIKKAETSRSRTEYSYKMCQSTRNDTLTAPSQIKNIKQKMKTENEDDYNETKQTECKNAISGTKYDSLKSKIKINKQMLPSTGERENNIPLIENKSVNYSKENKILTKAPTPEKEKEYTEFLQKAENELKALVKKMADNISSNKEDKFESDFKETKKSEYASSVCREQDQYSSKTHQIFESDNLTGTLQNRNIQKTKDKSRNSKGTKHTEYKNDISEIEHESVQCQNKTNKLLTSSQEIENSMQLVENKFVPDSEGIKIYTKASTWKKDRIFHQKESKNLTASVLEADDSISNTESKSKDDFKKTKKPEYTQSNSKTENSSKMCQNIRNDTSTASPQKMNIVQKLKTKNYNNSEEIKQTEEKNIKVEYDKSIKDSKEKNVKGTTFTLEKEERSREFYQKGKWEMSAFVQKIEDNLISTGHKEIVDYMTDIWEKESINCEVYDPNKDYDPLHQ